MRPRQGGRGRAWGSLTQIVDCRDRKRDQDDHNGDDDCNQFSPTDLRGGPFLSVFTVWLLHSLTTRRSSFASPSRTGSGRPAEERTKAFWGFRPSPSRWPDQWLHP